jgi:hypothetical protein
VPEEPSRFDLNSEAGAPPPVEQMQFRRAEPLPRQDSTRRCQACNAAIDAAYYQVQGRDICPACAQRFQPGRQALPAHTLAKAALYGAGAALAGCAIYATVAIVTGLELALVAILIGIIVGKSIRHASHGLGGRPQQILAVALTYFAITASYLPVAIYHARKEGKRPQQIEAAGVPARRPAANAVAAIVSLAAILAVAPFLELGQNFVGGLLSIAIIFFGLRQAWRLTGRSAVIITGPYGDAGPADAPA